MPVQATAIYTDDRTNEVSPEATPTSPNQKMLAGAMPEGWSQVEIWRRRPGSAPFLMDQYVLFFSPETWAEFEAWYGKPLTPWAAADRGSS
jgi:hypothetical protein